MTMKKTRYNQILLAIILLLILTFYTISLNRASISYEGSLARDQFVIDSLLLVQKKIRKETKPSKPKFKTKFRNRRDLP